MPFYQGHIQNVEVRDVSGQIIWIHGRHFRTFFTLKALKGCLNSH
ncbi:DUF2835 family protein [Shewanella surugensis]|uniref:DUF2835 domain-containing protein n=1 Tax=Shewanella surugensis TaxID=212020 RepID=A0ABT0LB26_9GAMM|nr:DUF2835 family protein [Shewanella surugensis]MCL1124874.1 DUF2835 domain-containing protein [Shewanella surugensis]